MISNHEGPTRRTRGAIVAGSFILILILQGFAGIDAAWGTTLQSEDQKLMMTDSFASYAVAIDDDVALLGAFILRGSEKDAVYVYRKIDGEWVREQALIPWGDNIEYYFKQFTGGLMYRSLAIDGNVALVPGYSVEDSVARGAVYVFRWDGASWNKEQKLDFGDDSRRFDGPVALRGDLAVVGGWQTEGEKSVRAVSVFKRNAGTWTEEQVLLAPAEKSGGFFGHEVAISDDGDMVVVGSGFYSAFASSDPEVYVFRREDHAWIETQRLSAFQGEPAGHSVALSGPWLFASNPLGPFGTIEDAIGEVAVFHWEDGGWVQRQTLRASDSFPFNNFGEVVDVEGDVAVIGADIQPVNGSPVMGYEGQAYLFRLVDGVWKEEKKLVTAEAKTPTTSVQAYGYTAGISGDTALVSAVGGTSPGGVYSYSIAGSPEPGCGCSSEGRERQAAALHDDHTPRSIHIPWLFGVLLVPFVLSIIFGIKDRQP